MSDTATYTTPDPVINPETAAWWQAAQEGRLMVARCNACGASHHYPRALCPHCFGADIELVPSAGKGRVYSVSVQRRGVPVPYAIAYVTLDEGVTLLSHVVECDLDAVRIGDRVEVVFQASQGGQQVPMFRPAAA